MYRKQPGAPERSSSHIIFCWPLVSVAENPKLWAAHISCVPATPQVMSVADGHHTSHSILTAVLHGNHSAYSPVNVKLRIGNKTHHSQWRAGREKTKQHQKTNYGLWFGLNCLCFVLHDGDVVKPSVLRSPQGQPGKRRESGRKKKLKKEMRRQILTKCKCIMTDEW